MVNHRPPRASRQGFILVALLAAGCDRLIDQTTDCAMLCQLEDDCGLRSLDDCVAQSCDDTGTFRVMSQGDECMLAVETCAEVALCSCASSCAAIDSCAGAADDACEASCEVLIEQDPVLTFQENRCRIEASCEELPLCGAL